MKQDTIQKLGKFIELSGLDEEPMGVYYTDRQPAEGFSPEPMDLPSRERESKKEINWGAVSGSFSCVIGAFRSARSNRVRI